MTKFTPDCRQPLIIGTVRVTSDMRAALNRSTEKPIPFAAARADSFARRTEGL